MKITSYNCGGLGSKYKKEAIRDLVRMEKIDILLLQETKLSEADMKDTLKEIWKNNKAKILDSTGAS